jgi:hypothetical protein
VLFLLYMGSRVSGTLGGPCSYPDIYPSSIIVN